MDHSAFSKGLARLSLAAGLCVASAGTAYAGPPEVLGVMTQHPTNPKIMLFNYENALGGLLYSDDGGRTVRIHPGMGFTETGLRELVHPLFQQDGTLLVPSRDGLFVGKGDVCLTPHSLGSIDVARPAPESASTAVTAHPSEPNVSYYLTNDASTTRTGLWKRAADGTVSALGPSDGAAFDARDLRVITRAESAGGLRFLELGRKAAKPVLRISDTQGDSWQELPISAAGTDNGYPRFLAVVPGEPLKLAIVVEKIGNPDPLDLVLYSSDGGQTFATYAEPVTRVIQSLVLPDGRFFFADQGGNSATAGLWMAESVGAVPIKLVDYPVHCLGYDPDDKALLLCKGYELGRFDPATKGFCRMFQLNETQGFVCNPTNLPTPDGASTTTAKRVQDQLCTGFCGAAHFASAPLCAFYNVRVPACGLGARLYDQEGPEELRWVEPPGTKEERCQGFEPRPPMADAGVAEEQDAGVADAGMEELDASAAAPDASSDDEPRKGGDDGCSVGTSAPNHAVLALLAALSLSTLTRRRRARS